MRGNSCAGLPEVSDCQVAPSTGTVAALTAAICSSTRALA